MQLHVGQAALRGDIARYARRFDLLELRAEPGKLPKLKVLREWAKVVPERFVFSVMLPRIVGTLEPQPELEEALGSALSTADALSAKWLVLQTPPTVMPSSRTRKRLAELVQRLAGTKRRVAWDPRGVWQDEETNGLAEELGVVVVRDLTRQEPGLGDTAYCRLVALGEASRVRSGAVERLFENIVNFEDAYVVIEGDGAVRAAQLLRRLAGESEAILEEEDEDGGAEEELDGDSEDEEVD